MDTHDDRRDVWARRLLALALAAAMVLAAQSEYELARAVGWPPLVAAFAPLALDSYVLAAVLMSVDVAPAMTTAAASVFASHGVYAAPLAWEPMAGHAVTPGAAGAHLIPPLAAICSAVPLAVAWRVHTLTHKPAAKPARTTAKPTATSTATAAARTATAAATSPAKPTATRAATGGPVGAVAAVKELPLDRQLEWFRRELAEHPERTAAEWAAVTGIAQRTVERRLGVVRGTPVQSSNGLQAAGSLS